MRRSPRPADPVRLHLPLGGLGLALLLGSIPAFARPELVVPKVPSIEEVVAREGFIPTLSQSDTYRPGVVLIKNAQGGHDEVVADCVGVAPTVKVMSQSSIATSLSAGVSARLAVARGEVAGGIEKRLSFVDPEQRSIPLAKLEPTAACREDLKRVGKRLDLSEAVLVYDVLVAQIQNTVCTRADAKGRVVALGAAEAAAYSECVTESDAQVPLGYKALPIHQFMDSPAVVVKPSEKGGSGAAQPVPGVVFEDPQVLGVSEKLKLQRCDEVAKEKGAAARSASLSKSEQELRQAASVAWSKLSVELEACTKLKVGERGACVAATEGWLAKARAMPLRLPAGEESVQTECGVRKPAFGEETRVVAAEEVPQAEAMLVLLRAPDGPVAGAKWTGKLGYEMLAVPGGSYEVGCTSGQSGCDKDETRHTVKLSRGYYMGRTEVTQGLWKQVMGTEPWLGTQYFSGEEQGPCKDGGVGSNLPVMCVTWADAVRFANAMSAKEGLEQCYAISGESVTWSRGAACTGYRLPTEAEWEVAARGGREELYSGGTDGCKVGNVGNVGQKDAYRAMGHDPDSWTWTLADCNDGHAGLSPVGSFRANGYGLVDMSGNVFEWAWDWYGTSVGSATDPTGAPSASSRVARGGSWRYGPARARVSDRGSGDPGTRGSGLGFRLARTIP